MANDNFNKPLLLINNKPNADNMVSNGYGFYMFPTLTMQYANTVLTDCERRLYFAICGQAGKDKLGNPYCWAIKHYCDIANIKVNHYAKYLQSLQKKGFIIHNDFESIEVLYPISQEQYIAPNGEICFWQDSLNRNNAQENFSIEEVQNSPNGKSGIDNIQATALPKKEEQAQNGNNAYNFSNKNSPKCANNREIKINKEKERISFKRK